MSGEVVILSCQLKSPSEMRPNANSPSAKGSVLTSMRCTCSSARITGPTKKMNRTRPGASNMVRRRSPWRGGIALIAAALARRDRFADERLRQRHEAAAAEALDRAKDRQHQDARRQCA